MWKCPKCGRDFTRKNQGHYCGKAPETVDEYIEAQSPEARAHLFRLRSIILRSVPDATERIAWSMPRYEKNGRSMSFASCKKHISLYAEAQVLESLRPQLSEFVIRKNALYLPYDQALPVKALEIIAIQSFGKKQSPAP